MKRLVSIFLCICMISGLCWATADSELGYGDSYGFAEDGLADELPLATSFDKNYAIAFNDFEAIENYSGLFIFPIEDAGGASHGKAFLIPARTSAAVPGTGALGNYSWNGTSHELFYEEIEEGEDYIFTYEYWSDPNADANADFQRPFSIAPCHKGFLVGTDYRHYPQYYGDGNWHRESLAFTATTNEKDTFSVADRINIKINTLSSNIKSYLDNMLIMKAGEFIIKDTSGCISLSVLSDNVISSESRMSYNDKTAFALGSIIRFKLSSNNPLITVGTVKMGETQITPDSKGIYTVKATDDIVVSSAVNPDIINEKFTIDGNNNIYFSDKVSLYELSRLFGVSNALTAHRGAESVSEDIYLKANDKIGFYADESLKYNVKYIGDLAEGGDGEFTVSDVMALVDCIFGRKDQSVLDIMYDINGSGVCTISDVVNLRNKILQNKAILPDQDVINNMDEFVSDVLRRSGTGATTKDLENGIYHNGNRAAIADVIRKAMAEEEITIVYFGGSITAGSGNDVSINSTYTGTPPVTSNTPSFSTEITETGG